MKHPFSDCRNEETVESIFGSVSEFARLCEEHGDSFIYGKVQVKYNPKLDVHFFYDI